MTLEDALKAAEDALCDKFCPAGDGELCVCKSAHLVETVLQSIERAGFVLCNKTLTMEQRNAAHDAMTSNRYNIQPMFDAILQRIPK